MSSLDVFRGIVRASSADAGPVLDVAQVDGGFILEACGQRLMSARGSVRVFRTLDAVSRYVLDHLATPLGSAIELRLLVAPEVSQ